MRTEDLEKAYPHVDDEGRRYRLIGGGAAAPRDYYVPGAPLPPPASATAARTDEAGAAAVPSTRESLLIQLKELLWLETLSQLGAAIPNTSRPTCFISYAWGNEATEECVHKLAIDLKCAGIDIVIDVIHNRDDSIAAFKEQILKTDTVLVMGTPELKYKWEKRIGHVVPQELDLIDDRTRSRAPHQVIRALLRASPDASFPDFMKLILPLVDLTLDISIEEEILKLLNFLYLAKIRDAKEPHCLKLQEEAEHWHKLKDELAALSAAELETQLKAYTEKHGEALKTKKGLKEHYAAEAAITRRLRATQEARAELRPWDPPHANRYFAGRESQLTELAKALQAKQSGVIAQMVAGLGGVGKTTLAIEYAERAKNKRMQGDIELNYDKIFWINAQSPSFSLRALARALNLPVDDYKDDSDLMRVFYAHVVRHYSRCLLILDDVENYAAIEQYLPQTSYDSIHILMTSRSREWTATPIHPVLLDGFTRPESIDYIHRWLPSESKEAKSHLAALLYDFPLALSQALAYINQYKLSIEDYIASYQTHEKLQQELLEHEAPILSGELKEDARKRAVYTTWHLSIKKLTSDPATKAAGELAEKLLSLSAYLLSHDIPIAFLEKLLGCSRLELGEALNLLSQHSLIQLDGSESYGMHQLLQEVIRLHEYKREESLILPLITQFETELNPDAYEVIKEQEGLFRHLDHLLGTVMHKESLNHLLGSFFSIIGRVAEIHGRLGSYEALLKAKAYYEFLLLTKEKTGSDEEIGSVWILGNLALVFAALGDVAKQKAFLEKALRIQVAHYKTEEHVEVAITLGNLANAIGALGDVVKQKVLLEKVLRIQVAHYKTEEHVMVARTLNDLANATGQLGDMKKKKELLEKAMEIMIRHYKTEEHVEVAKILMNLANATGALGNVLKKKELLEKVTGIMIRHYKSEEHVEVAKVLGDLANATGALGDVLKKKELLEKVLRIQFAHYKTEEHIEIAKTLNDLANATGELGDVLKMKVLLKQALRIEITYYKTEEHIEVAKTLGNLANAAGRLGDLREEKVLLEQVLRIMTAHYKTEEHAELAIAQFNLAQVYSRLRDYTAALNLMSKAYAGFRRDYGESHPHTQSAKKRIAELGLLISSADIGRRGDFIASNAMKAHTLLSAANAALTEGNMTVAIHRYEAFIELEPESAFAHHNLGCCYHIQAALNSNQVDLLAKAESHFIQSYAIEAHSGICVEYANFLCRLSRFSDAIPYLEMATSEAVRNDGKKLCYMSADKMLVPKVIRVDIEKLGEISLTAVELGYFLLVQAYLKTEQREKAQAAALALNQCVAESEHALSYCLVGYAYKLLGKYEIAANYFALASNLRESYILAEENLKECLDKMASEALTTAGLFAPSAAGGGGAAGAAAASLAASLPTIASDSERVKPHSEDEFTVDLVALASQRSISKIKWGEFEKSCVVVPAKADGDCGFHATHLSLELQGKTDLASQLNRESFIRLVSTLYNNPSLEPEIRAHIESIFLTDGARNAVDWQIRFKSRGYWLQEAHFKFLSRQFNLHFNFYYLDEASHQFVSEPTYESIYTGKEADSATIISLAHVSTRLKDKHDASLNHFDAIMIEPTETQIKHIASIMDTETKHSTSAISFESAAIPSPVVSEVMTRSSRESLMMQLKELLWLETLNGLGALIPEAARPSCFMSYAWGDKPSEERVHELVMDLKSAGVKVVIDITDSRDGSIATFTERVHETDTVLVVGTPELKYKWEKRIGHVVPQELDLIAHRIRNRAPHHVIRVLLRENTETSFPDFMKEILPIIDLKLSALKEEETLRLLNFLYLAKMTDLKEPYWIKLQEECEHWHQVKAELAKLSEGELETQLKAYTEKHGEALKTKKGLKEPYAAEAAITRCLRATEEAGTELSPWDPPHVNPYFIGRESQLTELAKALQANQSGVIAQMVVGLGGVGKTTLAIEYAERAKNKRTMGDIELNYDKIFWINVQSPSFSFRALARALNLPVDDYKDDSDLMRVFYAHVASHYSRCLLILDDVENYAAIKQYSPHTSYNSIHILMTSRSREWTATPIHSILLDGFARTESIDYIHKWLPSESKEAKTLLADLLHDFPAALGQAVAYIDQYKLSIENYIESYQAHEKMQQELLEYEAPVLSSELKEDTRKRAVYTTWHLSIEKLRSDPTSKTVGELAEKLLTLSAYLLSHNIPITFLEKLLGCSKLESGAALNLLSQYSLIQLDGSEYYGMHQLLQEVIRLHKYTREESWIIPLITQFEMELKPDAYEVIKEQEGLFRHLDYLLSTVMHKESLSHLLGSFFSIIGRVAEVHLQLGNYEALLKAKTYYEFLLRLNKEKTGSDEEIGSAWILNNLALIFEALGDVVKQKELLEKVLLIQIVHYKTEKHVEVAKTLMNLATAVGALGDVVKQKVLLEKVLEIEIAHYKTEEPVEVARTLANLATAVGALGDVVKQKMLLEKALRIMIAHYKTEEHVEVAKTLANLANTIGDLGDVAKKKELLEKVLRIQIAHYKTEEHAEVARTLANLANAVGDLGDVVKKKELLEKALPIQIAHYKTEEHAEVAITQFNLAQVYLGLNDYTAALNLMNKAYAGFNRGYGESHPHTQLAKKTIAVLTPLVSSAIARGGAGFPPGAAASHPISSVTPTVVSASTATHSSALEAVLAKYQFSEESALPTPEKALRRAAARAVLDDVKFLVTQVRNINEADEMPGSRRTALHWAVLKRHAAIVKELLERGAKRDIKDAADKTAEDYARELGLTEIQHLFRVASSVASSSRIALFGSSSIREDVSLTNTSYLTEKLTFSSGLTKRAEN